METPGDVMLEIGESISYDKKLYKQDLRASQVHAKMLARIGVLSREELNSILKGLGNIQKEIESNQFVFSKKKEDIHMHVESRLIELIGDTGKKLHTGRSRNDQVAQDVRLYLLDSLKELAKNQIKLLNELLEKAKTSIDSFLPGYTHLQIAQPIRASHYFLAHFWAFYRDLEEMLRARDKCSELVLGSGALAGVNFKSDRAFMAKELGLKRISENSIDAVSQRDHILAFFHAVVPFCLHASRISEEIILYTSTEFSYFKLPDSLTTGSSIMPQKKNPDIAEIIRGKSGRVLGAELHLKVMLKGTPLAYNRDFQEDKIPLFETKDQIVLVQSGLVSMVNGLKIEESQVMKNLEKGFATATDLADYLVANQKIPFRVAHEAVGRLVKHAVSTGKTLAQMEEKERMALGISLPQKSYLTAISLQNSCDKKDVFGGTARKRQLEQIRLATKRLKSISKTMGVS